MIRALALGTVCLAGLGAITAGAKKSPPPQSAEIVFPLVVGNKADRLTIVARSEASAAEENLTVYTPAPEEKSGPPPQPRPEEAAAPSATADFIPRHWHDPLAPKVKTRRSKSRDAKEVRKTSPAGTSNKIADARDCRTDGLDPLLRKLNLSPPCDR